MKHKLLLTAVAIVATMLSLPARAGSWVAPTPTPASFTSGNIYYLYNTGAGQFFTEGNDWNTRASIGSTGLKVQIDKLEDGSYTLYNYSMQKSGWLYLWIESAESAWVDMVAQGHNFFTLTDMGSQTYRISCFASDADFGAAIYPNCFFGYNSSVASSTVITPLLNATTEGACIDWKLIPETEYAIYQSKKGLYDMLNEAEAKGVDTNSAAAVYANSASTTAELDAAAEALKASINSSLFNGATATNPADVTSLITNPEFTSNSNGWTGTAPTVSNQEAEFYNKTFDINQTLTGLATGVYMLKAQGYFRPQSNASAYTKYKDGTDNIRCVLYANTTETPFMSVCADAQSTGYYLADGGSYGTYPSDFATEDGTYFANSMAGARSWFDAGFYDKNEVSFEVSNDSLKLGVKLSDAEGYNDYWCLFDNFRLYYYGSGSDAYKLMLKKTIDQAATTVSADDILGTPEKTALSTAQANAQSVYNNAAATTDEVKAADAALKEAMDNASASKTAYAALSAAMAEGNDAINLYSGTAADELSDLLMDAETSYNDNTYTAEEAEATCAKIKELIAQAKAQAISVGDVTYLITNPGFDTDATGWEKGTAPSVSFSEAEIYNKTFNVYQELKGLQNGKYTLEVAGFFRPLANGDAYAQYKAGTDNIRCVLYANDNQTPMLNVCADAQPQGYFLGEDGIGGVYPHDYITTDNNYTPNSMEGSRQWFDNGFYDKNKVSVVVTDNELTIGVKLDDATGYSDYWCLFDNFRLTYEGSSAEVLKDELDALVAGADTLKDKPMNADVKKALNEAIDAAANADDNALTVIAELNKVIPEAKASIGVYQTLKDALVSAENTINANAGKSAEATQAFSDVYNEVNGGYDNGTYADADVPAAIEKLQAATNTYLMSDANGTDESPVDVTNVIINPSFEDGQTGWTKPGGVNQSEMEQYNTNFDTYQTIKGLKNGTYLITVQGFYRAGLADAANTAHTNGTEALNAMLYGNGSSAPMKSIIEGTQSEMLSSDDSSITGGYVPNSMDGTRMYFDADLYTGNQVYANVVDGTLTIGIKKETTIASDWTIFDNFKLYYLGENSANGIDDAIASDATPVSTQYFGINGAANSKLVKGINIVKTTMSDGRVIVKKVLVK